MTSAVPIAYLKRCAVVRGVFLDGEMVAGYGIGATQPLRLLEFVPDEARATLSPPSGATWDDCSEIVCAWRSPALDHRKMNLWVWPRIVIDAVRTGKPCVLGHNENADIDRRYTKLGMKTLYTGPSHRGLHSHLFYYPRWRLLSMVLARAAVMPALLVLPQRKR